MCAAADINLLYFFIETLKWYHMIVMHVVSKLLVQQLVQDNMKGNTKDLCYVELTTMEHMMTSSNGTIFPVTDHLCGNSPVPGEFPEQRPVTRTFDVFFDLPLNKPLSKQSWGWWFETLSPLLWRHCNDLLRAPVATLICLYEFSIVRFLGILS